MLYDQFVHPLIFWTGSGGCDVMWWNLRNCKAAGHSFEKCWFLLSYNHGIISLTNW
jgi:hypothetical protein